MPNVPANAKKPSDHAAKAEAKDESDDVTFDFDEVTYTIPRDRAGSLDLQELLDDEKYVAAARFMLGEDQWTKFKESHRGGGFTSMDDFGRLMETAQGQMDPKGN